MAGKPEQPASHSGPALQQPQQQLSSLTRQQQPQQQQQLQEQQAALHQNSVLVYVSGDNLAYASAIDQQNALYQQQTQAQGQQQQDGGAFLHLPQLYSDKSQSQGFLSKETAQEFVALTSQELEVQEPLRASSRGSDEDSGRSLGPDDDDCLVDDGSFVVSQLEAAVAEGAAGAVIYPDDEQQDKEDELDDDEDHLKLLKLSKDIMLESCNGYVNGTGVYGFTLDEKSLGAFAAAAELVEHCDANANHQVAYVRQTEYALVDQQQQQQTQQQQTQQPERLWGLEHWGLCNSVKVLHH